MPIPIQQGSIADSLRNFLKLVGRAGTVMDEVIVPTVNVQNIGEPPWRTQERNWTTYRNKAAAAGTNSFVGVRMPLGARGVCTVRQVVIANATAVPLSYVLLIVPTPETHNNYTQVPVQNVEDMNEFGPGAVWAELPPLIFGADVAPLAFKNLVYVAVPAGSSVVLPVSAALRTGYGTNPGIAGPGLAVACTTVNTGVDVSFSGTFYPNAE